MMVLPPLFSLSPNFFISPFFSFLAPIAMAHVFFLLSRLSSLVCFSFFALAKMVPYPLSIFSPSIFCLAFPSHLSHSLALATSLFPFSTIYGH
jgi:hypothetical protein